MKRLFSTILILLFSISTVLSQEAKKQENQEAQQQEAQLPPNMTTYVVGFLLKGPKWTAESTPELEKLQEQHLAHIRDMGKSGKLILAGPFEDNGTLRGMFVFRVGSMEEARAMAEADPAVKAGRLIVELHPWLSMKGIKVDPQAKN